MGAPGSQEHRKIFCQGYSPRSIATACCHEGETLRPIPPVPSPPLAASLPHLIQVGPEAGKGNPARHITVIARRASTSAHNWLLDVRGCVAMLRPRIVFPSTPSAAVHLRGESSPCKP